ncbi:MAG: hypothetical protein ACSLFK_13425 [Gemmatimonadaceae bacterium]
MNNEIDYELTADEQVMFSSLRRELAPGDLLEERVVRALRSDGHFDAARRPARRLGQLVRIAAGIALFAGGVATGRYVMTPSEPQPAATAAPASMANETNQTREMPIPASGEMIVAETELWL